MDHSAAAPQIVGTHWFQWVDDLPTGRPGGGERLNYGFIDVLDLPYISLVQAVKATCRSIYELTFGTAVKYNEKPRPN